MQAAVHSSTGHDTCALTDKCNLAGAAALEMASTIAPALVQSAAPNILYCRYDSLQIHRA